MLNSRVKRALIQWVEMADGAAYVSRFEMTKRFRRIAPVSISYDGTLYKVEDPGSSIYVARKSRLRLQYAKGVKERRRVLQSKYGVQPDMLGGGALVIHCGANIGEFSVICAELGANVLSFEPDRAEFLVLKRNAQGRAITPLQMALWNKTGEMEFFDCNETGDSSLFDPGRAVGSYMVRTCRLDDLPQVADREIGLIKLEAEGAEPEILEGMPQTLRRTRYVAVDMGPERGQLQANTVVQCSEFLYDMGFRMRSFFHKRCSALFERLA